MQQVVVKKKKRNRNDKLYISEQQKTSIIEGNCFEKTFCTKKVFSKIFFFSISIFSYKPLFFCSKYFLSFFFLRKIAYKWSSKKHILLLSGFFFADFEITEKKKEKHWVINEISSMITNVNVGKLISLGQNKRTLFEQQQKKIWNIFKTKIIGKRW